VLAAIGVGWLLARPPKLPQWLGLTLGAVIAVAFIPGAVSAARAEHKDIAAQRKRTRVINELSVLVDKLGGTGKFKPCGEPLTRLQYQSMVAFTLRVNVASVGYKYAPAIAAVHRPIILITPGPVDGLARSSRAPDEPRVQRAPLADRPEVIGTGGPHAPSPGRRMRRPAGGCMHPPDHH